MSGYHWVVTRLSGKQALLQRRHRNVATVALANRMARTAWAVLASGKPYEENHVPA